MVRGVNKQTSRYIKETVSHCSHRRRPTGEQYSRRVVETESGGERLKLVVSTSVRLITSTRWPLFNRIIKLIYSYPAKILIIAVHE